MIYYSVIAYKIIIYFRFFFLFYCFETRDLQTKGNEVSLILWQKAEWSGKWEKKFLYFENSRFMWSLLYSHWLSMIPDHVQGEKFIKYLAYNPYFSWLTGRWHGSWEAKQNKLLSFHLFLWTYQWNILCKETYDIF